MQLRNTSTALLVALATLAVGCRAFREERGGERDERKPESTSRPAPGHSTGSAGTA